MNIFLTKDSFHVNGAPACMFLGAVCEGNTKFIINHLAHLRAHAGR